VTSDAFLPAVHTRPDYLNVVRPCGSQRGSQQVQLRACAVQVYPASHGNLAVLVDALSWPLRTLADDFIAWLLAVVRNRVALGAAIVGFSGAGLGMIIWSHAVTGWWQTALLGFGTSLLIVGTIELGVLGVLNKILEPKNPAVRTMNNFIEDFAQWANQPGSGLPEFPRPGRTDDREI
jgi:hypothetical protein